MNERAKEERTVKDDVRDRRIATTDSVEDPEIPRSRNGARCRVYRGFDV